MNTNQLINMITRMFVRKAMNYGFKAGTKALSSNDRAGRVVPQDQRDGDQMKQTTKQARQAMRMTKRMTRM